MWLSLAPATDKVLVGWGIVRVVTTGWRRGSDDAIGAEVLPQLRWQDCSSNITASAAAICWREAAACLAHADAPGADHHWLKQVLPLGQWSRALPHTNAASPIATVLPISGTAA